MRGAIRNLAAIQLCLFVSLAGVGVCSSAAPGEDRTSPRFRIDLYAEGIENACSMTLSPKGVLLVGTRREGKGYAVVDSNGDRRAEKIRALADGRKPKMPGPPIVGMVVNHGCTTYHR